ncbi:hypothetical protein DLAC_04234 [Tieghemostelium lacteum]|uniref:Uncharacterized protein n=1 Tax=Tieghemostelium lacteum TaxID=361077 RepID=A0A151ZSN6_TIELA|nr:hypothetical protein DLAC_04234 [Tieghemostelium lacteum]|eukprot:KYQ96915.1 hypothetical protein DLAC_04234 [Tieghemostelium lacteum]
MDEHYICPIKPSGELLAWSEGYAHVFSQIMGEELGFVKVGEGDYINWLIIESDPIYIDRLISWEIYGCHLLNVKEDEGKVAAMLYDFHDLRDDDLKKNEGDINRVSKDLHDIYDNYAKANNEDPSKPKVEPIKVDKEKFFGNSDGNDKNQGNRITTHMLLFENLINVKGDSLTQYIDTLYSSSDSKTQEFMDKIMLYHYGDSLIPKK